MKNLIGLFLLTIILSALGCRGNKSDNSELKDSLSTINASFLDDGNFIFKNLTNTEDAKFTYKALKEGGIDGNLYTDSTYKKSYTKLTPDQKSVLIAPFISKELGVNDKYARDLMNAYFVSKQDKIGEFQPIIIEIDGDDYGSLTMVILDKNNKPVSAFSLSGGMEPGPTTIGDSLISYDKTSYSHLKKDIITTYRIKQTDQTDSTKKGIIIDSNVFISQIDKTGQITTKQTIKAHYRKNP